jgi:hypothetical protein
MKKKLWIFGIGAMLGIFSSFNSSAAMELKETSTAYLINGEWRITDTATYFQAGLPDGWHKENGKTFYVINGSAVTSSIKVDGKWYFFDELGTLIEESSQEYFKITGLLSQMHEAKVKNDTSWEYAFRSLTEYQKYMILDAYCKQYLYGAVDVGNAGFKFSDNKIMIDMDHPRYEAERKTEEFFQRFAIHDSMSDARKVRLIHDTINKIFSYDYTLSNSSSELLTAFQHHNKIVCGGYAGIFDLACKKYGLESEVVTGMADDGMGTVGMHAWNKVKINDEWEYIDCTWDDAVNSLTWFLKSKEYFDKTHFEF